MQSPLLNDWEAELSLHFATEEGYQKFVANYHKNSDVLLLGTSSYIRFTITDILNSQNYKCKVTPT